jgi:hypothetical protein
MYLYKKSLISAQIVFQYVWFRFLFRLKIILLNASSFLYTKITVKFFNQKISSIISIYKFYLA